MGPKRRAQYSAIGDPVRLAGRLVKYQKIHQTSLVMDVEVYRRVVSLVEVRRLDVVRLTGRDELIELYEVLGRKGDLGSEQYIANSPSEAAYL